MIGGEEVYARVVALRFDCRTTGLSPRLSMAQMNRRKRRRMASSAFANKRAEVWWKFREALDPDQPDGSAIALPPDPELRADLCSPTWKLGADGPLCVDGEVVVQFEMLPLILCDAPACFQILLQLTEALLLLFLRNVKTNLEKQRTFGAQHLLETGYVI